MEVTLLATLPNTPENVKAAQLAVKRLRGRRLDPKLVKLKTKLAVTIAHPKKMDRWKIDSIKSEIGGFIEGVQEGQEWQRSLAVH